MPSPHTFTNCTSLGPASALGLSLVGVGLGVGGCVGGGGLVALTQPPAAPADLTRLTSLCLDQAFDFGSRALWALTHLPSLRRLALSGTSLNRYSLLSLLSNDDEDGPPALLPGLTYLALRNCQLLRWACCPCPCLRTCPA